MSERISITLNGTPLEVPSDTTLLTLAAEQGVEIPALCWSAGKTHTASCMVCAVKNEANGQLLPACSTLPAEGMRIDTESAEVQAVRRLSLELLLSDHRADCEAPCSLVCPHGLNIEQLLAAYDHNRPGVAHALLAASFCGPEIPCDTCKAPCESACKRGRVDRPVAIREIIREVLASPERLPEGTTVHLRPVDKESYQSRMGPPDQEEKRRLQACEPTPSGCLHCACAGREKCRLRRYATRAGIKRSRYGNSSSLVAMEQIRITGRLRFEPAKCIRCGVCVYNTDNGFTFRDRGFVMQVVLPPENRAHIPESVAGGCPVGALYLAEE